MDNISVEQSAVNTLRVLSVEAIAAAKSGHSGIALGAAPAMYSIYKHMRFDPTDGTWFNRDRFVMSAGHGSALLYATLHAFGFNNIDLSTFRQLDSPLSGHPELDEAIGVDCSTGPLGQGVAMAVGIAAAEKRLAATYNKKEHNIIDHFTFCLCGDGCLQEGISYEACNLAGLWRLNKLILVYDSNKITLDGERSMTDVEDVAARFQAMRWNVLTVKQGWDERAIGSRIRKAMTSVDAPTLIIVETEIGHGAKNSGTHKAHGQVLNFEEVAALRGKWLLPFENFSMSQDVQDHFAALSNKKRLNARKWHKTFKKYQEEFPKQHKQLLEFIEKPYLDLTCEAEGKSMATRDAGGIMLTQVAKQTARLWGGSADVATTTKAQIDGATTFSFKKPKGDDIAFGIREFAMAAITNGIALHGYMPFCSTFLAFSDYCRPAMRLGAMMDLPVTYIFTHDGLGNAPDGPTHQATEHIAALRLVPNLMVFRPANDLEVAAVFEFSLEQQHPAVIILSRNTIHNFELETFDDPHAVILASGAEVSLCAEVQAMLASRDIEVNVISVPCLEMFDSSVLNKEIPILAVEMGSGMPWWALIGKHGLRGDVVSFDTFGWSGTDAAIRERLGFTATQIAERVVKTIVKV